MNRAEVFLNTTLESRYRIDVVVRESSEFIVFHGRDMQTSNVVEIRFARAPRGMSMDELIEAIDAFNVEADQLRRLNQSPHVEHLLASGQYDGPDQEHIAYCVFSQVEGLPLSQTHPTGSPPMALPRAIRMLDPVASALAAAHDLGVFHGDVRPENMIVTGDVAKPSIKLINSTRTTRLGNMKAARTFSAAYGAPEHFKRSQEGGVGPATDTYGLALCVVGLVTGQPPLSGSTPSELYQQAMDIANRPTLRARGAQVSDDVNGVIARAVAVNPKLRWPNTREFWAALTEASSRSTSSMGIAAIDASAMADAAVAALAKLPPSSSNLPAIPPIAPSSVPILPVAPTPSIQPPAEPLPPPVQPTKSGGGGFKKVVIALIVVAVCGGGAFVAMRKKPWGTTAPTVTPSASHPPAPSATPSASASAAPIASADAAPPPKPVPEGMLLIPAGTFTMGKEDAKTGRPAHRVTLTHAFYMDRTEVTIEQYRACVAAGSCTQRVVHLRRTVANTWGCNIDGDKGTYPANCVDRKQAIAFCAYAKKRLPTEAEWEYAARGTDDREYPWGNSMPKSCSTAVLAGMTGACGDRRGTSPVGTAPDGASPFGLLDVGGNVWEWVADDYANYSAAEATDPMVTVTDTGDTPLRGVLRGGSWDYGPESSKTTYRLPFIADAGNASTGVRCAQSE
jgi:formylglycine-generating enzyme required for sulfatase activity